jgi:hypothetical protein
MFFDLNADSYQMISNGNCDFALYPKQADKILYLDLWHNQDHQFDRIKDLLETPNIWVISNVYGSFQHPRYRAVDFLFNRTKAYYQQYPWTPGVQPWYWKEFAYQDFTLLDASTKTHIFLAPNKTHNKQRPWRSQLVDILINYLDLGHVGNADQRSHLYLYCHHEQPWAQQLGELSGPTTTKWLGYSPPHNLYYQDTFVSIYGETVESGSDIVITEKTYDPLIKGHFILPFSSAGFVQHLKTLGYRFPTFIDYSYDNVVDDVKRFSLYQYEVQRLLAQSHQQWCDWWNANLDILLYNKRIMHERPYDRVDIKSFMRA